MIFADHYCHPKSSCFFSKFPQSLGFSVVKVRAILDELNSFVVLAILVSIIISWKVDVRRISSTYVRGQIGFKNTVLNTSLGNSKVVFFFNFFHIVFNTCFLLHRLIRICFLLIISNYLLILTHMPNTFFTMGPYNKRNYAIVRT